MKKIYFAPKVEVVVLSNVSILAGSTTPQNYNRRGGGVQLSKGGSFEFEDDDQEE